MSVTAISIVIIILLSAFFSGMEIAFVSANKLRFEIDRQKNEFAASIIDIYYAHPDRYISTMLVGNNIALVIYGILMADVIRPFIIGAGNGAVILLLQTLISTLVILIAGEFVPKMLFRSMPNFWMNVMAAPLFLFYIILYPISMFMTWISRLIMRVFKVNIKEEQEISLGKVDLDFLLQESTEAASEESEDSKEVKIFQNALDFSKVKLRDCMVPRTEIEAVAFDDSVEELTKLFCESGRSKILVYKENIDNIIGYVHSTEIFKRPQKWQDKIILVPIVPETMAANKLMNLLLLKKKSMAVVVDEFGGTAGIVTLEDIVEEIFGEIEDEHDTQDYVERMISDSEYIFSGRLEIDYINGKYGLELPINEDYQTLAGLVLFEFQGIPAESDEIQAGEYTIKVIKASQNKIELLKLQKTIA